MKTETAEADEIVVGDVLEVWGHPDTVVALAPYDGPLVELQGGRVARFASGTRMTLEPGTDYGRIIPSEEG